MTRIVTDTTSGLDSATARQLRIPMISQVINFGDESFREGVDLDHDGFMERLLQRKHLPKTSAPYPGDFIEAYSSIPQKDGPILSLHPSADVSGTVRSAEVARDSCPGADIRIIDTRTVGGPLASIVLEAYRLVEQGMPADEVVAHVEQMKAHACIYFVVDTMEFLQRGGRIGSAAAFVGTVLQIKPLLSFKDGRIEPYERERTRHKALRRLKELVLAEAAPGPDGRLTVMHAAAPDAAVALAAELGSATGGHDVAIMNLVPAIVTHAGPGVLAVGFFTPS